MNLKPSQTVEPIEQPQPGTPLAPLLGVLTLARIVITGSRRFPYVILTPMAAALSVPRSTLEAALSLQWAVGAFSPLAGSSIERLGRKRVMSIGLLMLTLSAGAAAIGHGFGVVVLAIVAGGLGKMIYDPAMQAYIGDRVPYTRRAMAIGVTELSWSGSLVIFGPLAAFLITQVSLNAIYAVITIGGLLSFALLARLLPDDVPTPQSHVARLGMRAAVQVLFASHPALAMLLASALISTASELINIAYEGWLRQAFALSTVMLGVLSWAISAAEVSGEGLVITVADRFGKRRLTLLSLVAAGLLYVVLPLTTSSLPVAIGILFLMFLSFEVSVVALIPLATEVLPNARGIMMSSNLAAASIGRALGTLSGGWLLRTVGFGANGLLAGALNLLAALLIWRFTALSGLD